MNVNGSAISERMDEARSVCARYNPIHGEISNFSLALYVLGSIKAPDIMSAEDFDMSEAAAILRENFREIDESEIASEYSTVDSKDRYLLVLGDPQFPVHFAALVDKNSKAPFFSKLPYFGSGFDSLEELRKGFSRESTTGICDAHYFRAI
ncbi:MAG: hypothetical protein V2B19_16655 [Pseudomonadota bacterium]